LWLLVVAEAEVHAKMILALVEVVLEDSLPPLVCRLPLALLILLLLEQVEMAE
jgi:hypothetical protein